MRAKKVVIAIVATVLSAGLARAETIEVEMESAREDSVQHLFKPMQLRFLVGPQLTEGLPQIASIEKLQILQPLHARLEFLDSPAELIIVLGLDGDGQDIAFAVIDSTAQPQPLELTKRYFERIQGEALYAELTVPAAGQVPEFRLELLIDRERNAVLHRSLELRLGQVEIGPKRFALALVRDPRFATYTLPDVAHGFNLYQLMIDLDGNGEFLTLNDRSRKRGTARRGFRGDQAVFG